ncbi:AMP-binding protein [Bradyrhizobium lablabi]|nr:AMP-binding protein [Bradyrhizobium lablabi]
MPTPRQARSHHQLQRPSPAQLSARKFAGLDRHRASDRVATLAWNSYRHLELYFGISGIGAVCHTINPRLFAEQIIYIINHAEDVVVFFDLAFIDLVHTLIPRCPTVELKKSASGAKWKFDKRGHVGKVPYRRRRESLCSGKKNGGRHLDRDR